MSERIQLRRHPKYVGLALALIAVVIGTVVFSMARASASSDVVQDPKGDALSATESANYVDPGTPEDVARGYLDIKSVKLTKNSNNYVFSMTLGAPVPADMSTETCYGLIGDPSETETVVVDPSKCFFAWNWDVFSGPDVVGLAPLSPTVRWSNGSFQALAFRTPSGQPPITLDSFEISGAHITVTVDASVIEDNVGDPADGFSFRGTSRNHRIDFGGNPYVGLADYTDGGYLSK